MTSTLTNPSQRTKLLTQPVSDKPDHSRVHAIVGDVIRSLMGVFPRWRSAFKSREEFLVYRREFLNAMVQFGITDSRLIKRGIEVARDEAAKGREYLPGGPQFAAWCSRPKNAAPAHRLFTRTRTRLADKSAYERAAAAREEFQRQRMQAGL